jgi:hypothetical protein
LNLIELPGKKMVGVLDPMNLFGLGQRVKKRLHFGARRKLVLSSLNDELGFWDTLQIVHVPGTDRNSESDKRKHARISCADRQTNSRPERKSNEANRNGGEANAKVIQRCRDVLTFADAIAEASGALSHSPKIKAQRRQTCLRGGLGGSENYLVVHRPAVKRMRMAHQRREAGL